MMDPISRRRDLPADRSAFFKAGTFIPAVPLAQKPDLSFDLQYQKALIRYYIDSGVGGIAVGVHSTQFEIRDPSISLYEPVLKVVQESIDEWLPPGSQFVRIAGLAGLTEQAISEARIARTLRYDIGLLSLAAFPDASDDELIDHCQIVAQEIPIMGFYLQPAVGGRILSRNFWQQFARIDGVVGIKISPFNRYQTLDVIRGVALAGRLDDIALYTGNDDNIVADLLTDFRVQGAGGKVTARINGGLLGHWAVWTKASVDIFNRIKALRNAPGAGSDDTVAKLLASGVQITDSNAAIFDAPNSFSGCLSGIHHVLFRQGLRQTIDSLSTHESLSAGQVAEIERIYTEYPHLTDDEFVSENLQRWLAE